MTKRILKSNNMNMTRDGIAFFQKYKNELGTIVRVEMKEYRKEEYPLRLVDDKGNEIWLSGMTSGYRGEGPRGLITILEELEALPMASKEELELIAFRLQAFIIGKHPDDN